MCPAGGAWLKPTSILPQHYLLSTYSIIPTLSQAIEKDKQDKATDKWEGGVRDVQ